MRNAYGQFAYFSIGGRNQVKVYTTSDNPRLCAAIPTGNMPQAYGPSVMAPASAWAWKIPMASPRSGTAAIQAIGSLRVTTTAPDETPQRRYLVIAAAVNGKPGVPVQTELDR